jgi:hypothetical protein
VTIAKINYDHPVAKSNRQIFINLYILAFQQYLALDTISSFLRFSLSQFAEFHSLLVFLLLLWLLLFSYLRLYHLFPVDSRHSHQSSVLHPLSHHMCSFLCL